MESKVEVKKVDPQGRVILPADWRQSEMKESRDIYIIREKGYLKIIPKRKVDLTEYFDKVDLNVEAIENWKKFEKRLYRSRS
jgi:bifunctional DNA-binding transcriptional regulator/antitoxin component of YhaV-PrlF toxin-antitoxin module